MAGPALTPGQIVAALTPVVGRIGAAGAAGNLMQESSDNPADAGGGLMQEQGSRYSGLLGYASAHGLNPNSGAANLGYLIQDLKGPYAGTAAQLRAAANPGQAATIFSNQYERPGTPMLGNRINYANQALAAAGGRGAAAGPGTGPALGVHPAGDTAASKTTTSGGGVNWNAAGLADLEKAIAVPIGSGSSDKLAPAATNLLGGLASAADSGNYNNPTTTTTNPPAPLKLGGGKGIGAPPTMGPVAPEAAGGVAKLGRMVTSVLGSGYNQANHDAINEGEGQIKAAGTDCSGLVSWLMGPQGLGIWHQSLATPAIPSAPGLSKGQGQSITIWNNAQAGNSGHVFIKIGNTYYASEGGTGVRELPLSEVEGYIQNGSDGGHYEAFHPTGY